MTARRYGSIFAAATALVLLGSAPAHAYLDPGTGSMILQGIIGAAVGGMIVLKLYWARVRNFFSTRGARHPTEDQDQPTDSH